MPNPLLENAVAQNDDEAKQKERGLRIKVVGKQRKIEIKLLFFKNVRVVFFIRNPLTGGYLLPEWIQYNEQKNIFEFTPEVRKDEKLWHT